MKQRFLLTFFITLLLVTTTGCEKDKEGTGSNKKDGNADVVQIKDITFNISKDFTDNSRPYYENTKTYYLEPEDLIGGCSIEARAVQWNGSETAKEHLEKKFTKESIIESATLNYNGKEWEKIAHHWVYDDGENVYTYMYATLYNDYLYLFDLNDFTDGMKEASEYQKRCFEEMDSVLNSTKFQ